MASNIYSLHIIWCKPKFIANENHKYTINHNIIFFSLNSQLQILSQITNNLHNKLSFYCADKLASRASSSYMSEEIHFKHAIIEELITETLCKKPWMVTTVSTLFFQFLKVEIRKNCKEWRDLIWWGVIMALL